MTITQQQAFDKLDQLVLNSKKKDQIIQEKDQEIISKNDLIARLDAIIKGSAIIFQNRQQRIEKLMIQCQKDQHKKEASKEYIEHCKEDIKRLDEEKKELDQRIEELENLNEENKRVRDTEIKELREKLINLAQMNENLIKVDQQVYDILGQVSQQTGLLPRAQQVVAILKKPKREIETQTDITIPPTDQWETDLEKYKQDIQKEQNKVSLLQTKLSNLRQEIKDLQEQSQINLIEKKLLTFVRWKDWKSSDYQKIKQKLETGQLAYEKVDWGQLHSPYTEIRTKLLELVNALIEGKESQEQLENRNKELEEKLKEGGLNEVEKELLKYMVPDWQTTETLTGNLFETPKPDYNQILQELQGEKWNKLREEYENIRQKLIQLAEKELEVQQNQQTITELTQKKDQLQKDLDLATKTKEELAEELAIEKGWWDKWINGDDGTKQSPMFDFVAKKVFVDEGGWVMREKSFELSFICPDWHSETGLQNQIFPKFEIKTTKPEKQNIRYGKQIIKFIYEYYRWIYDIKINNPSGL
ncbi:Putative Viral A-type inclusion protein (fragment) [endosymbiont DhMRE of Dentiscutata heterogama]|uniref:hypothetical protein n=1 Tax=endosymbiont DhMRE of Dentiscutata heterogama TaxID=1609546 RepID=UPI000629D7C6